MEEQYPRSITVHSTVKYFSAKDSLKAVAAIKKRILSCLYFTTQYKLKLGFYIK
jgi:hypothetical protein